MSLPLPNLDDRNFADLIVEMRALIPRYASQWTNHNVSDPGITLIELLSWLTEMILYRQNIITDRNRINFLKLILDPPVPVTVDLTINLDKYLENDYPIPKGTQFTTLPDVQGNHFIFETYQEYTIPKYRKSITLRLRNCTKINDEIIGTSDGSPNQLFSFSYTPVLIDNLNTGLKTGDYNPNPKIVINGVEWYYVRDFLDPPPADPDDPLVSLKNCFTVERLTHRLRFSDGKIYEIPPAGAEILCSQYQIILGDEIKVSENAGFNSISPPPGTTITSITNTDAEGGLNVYPLEKAKIIGLQKLKEQYRAISADDFLFLTTRIFNELQISSLPENQIARVKVINNRNLKLTSPEEKKGEISIIIIPFPKVNEIVPEPSSLLKYKVEKFLDARRLLGTRVHVVGPGYIPLKIQIDICRKSNVLKDELKTSIENRIRIFLNPLSGGFDNKGWPFGRNIYPSELYQLIESIEGVDYVTRLSLNGGTDDFFIELKENELPDPEETIMIINITP